MSKVSWKLIVIGIPGIIALAVLILAIRNMGLPIQSTEVAYLSELEKARVTELFHLRETLGDAVWPGWAEATIPVIVHNEAYAFLLGYPGEPPDGWIKVPHDEHWGGPWEIVSSDTFQGQLYYRQPLPNPNRTPENFTVLVGDRWVATLYTREYSEIAFYQGFRKDLPKFLRPIFPYRLVWNLLIDSTETYIGAMAHEAFHAYQGITAPQRLAEAELVAPLEDAYPWDNQALETAWGEEIDDLYQAVMASSDAEAAELARQFLVQRQARRAEPGMTPQFVDYERQREWLEGLAKYAELVIAREAGRTSDYQPIPAIQDDPDFKKYATRERFWSAQLGEMRRLKNRGGETRFYYVGMAQAVLLDRLMPDWKSRIWEEDVWLDDLLAEAVND